MDFLILAVISIVLNMIFISIIKKEPILIKDEDVPSRVGEFKDTYLIYPFLTMMVIGIVKILFILFLPFCRINANISWLTYIILIIIFLVGFFIEEFFRKVENCIKISFLTFSIIILFILFVLLTYSLDSSILGLNSSFDSSYDKDINIMIYSLLYFVGMVGLKQSIFVIKSQNNQFKFLRSSDLKSIFFYVFILMGILFLSCFPEYVKKILIFLSCIKNKLI